MSGPPGVSESAQARAARLPHAISERRAKLVALIEHLDSGIGKVLDTLDRTGLATNTLVIFTSDNGGVLANEANNGPWRGDMGHMYEGGLRVPGAARYPSNSLFDKQRFGDSPSDSPQFDIQRSVGP